MKKAAAAFPPRRIVHLAVAFVKNNKRRVLDFYSSSPPHVRALLLFSFVAWKFIGTFILLPLVLRIFYKLSYQKTRSSTMRNRARASIAADMHMNLDTSKQRILYISTSSSRYDKNGDQISTDTDRYIEFVLPMLRNVTKGLLSINEGRSFEVDVYLLLGYSLQQEDVDALGAALPRGIGYQIWDNALPPASSPDPHGGGLLQQERFILRDTIETYELFVFAHDGTRITADQVTYFNRIQDQLGGDAIPNFGSMPAFLEVHHSLIAEKAQQNDFESQFSLPLSDDMVIRSPRSALSDGNVTGGFVQHVPGVSADLEWLLVQENKFEWHELKIANQAQLLRLHEDGCANIFPSYGAPEVGSGVSQNFECRVRTFISLDEKNFLRHLVYHSASSSSGQNNTAALTAILRARDWFRHQTNVTKKKERVSTTIKR